ncbi:lipoyl(octanoyl) transferase LipB [Tunicatimonas pelagia]|uniref:lipoyl(octanoyl) transferase LipB n=1 Tax=Tunicatimonas pelagia TaxID=931531 RepID=UPI002666F2FD|nr:lipoyl(octanoyl) transferase LipB [Tunicatimonas pelagia]WKN45566.1 lipoyl(octanoyl) transferase LipB [Tunicatimonas pelagia]
MLEKNKQVNVQYLGLVDYAQAWDYQEEVFAEIIQTKIVNRKQPDQAKATENYLLFCEHPPVYTLGKSGKESNLLLSSEELAKKGVQYYPINRGGDITFHGPGQLVGYPVLDLDNFFTDIHRYLRMLEEAIILTLADYGIDGGRIAGLTGVWIDYEEQKNPRKICAMGVKASRWVTMHGFALNINTDLQYFDYIIPCGIEGKAVTSLAQELGKPHNMEEVSARLLKHLASLFEMDPIPTSC